MHIPGAPSPVEPQPIFYIGFAADRIHLMHTQNWL